MYSKNRAWKRKDLDFDFIAPHLPGELERDYGLCVKEDAVGGRGGDEAG